MNPLKAMKEITESSEAITQVLQELIKNQNEQTALLLLISKNLDKIASHDQNITDALKKILASLGENK